MDCPPRYLRCLDQIKTLVHFLSDFSDSKMQLEDIVCNTSSAELSMYWRGAKFVLSVPISCPMTLLEQDADLYLILPSSK